MFSDAAHDVTAAMGLAIHMFADRPVTPSWDSFAFSVINGKAKFAHQATPGQWTPWVPLCASYNRLHDQEVLTLESLADRKRLRRRQARQRKAARKNTVDILET
jgi:hypothetical protein